MLPDNKIVGPSHRDPPSLNEINDHDGLQVKIPLVLGVRNCFEFFDQLALWFAADHITGSDIKLELSHERSAIAFGVGWDDRYGGDSGKDRGKQNWKIIANIRIDK